MIKTSTKKENGKQAATTQKRSYISQSDIPLYTLEEAIQVAQAVYDNGGSGTPPHNVAIALDLSPTAAKWRDLSGSAIAYGLTNGGRQANEVTLTELGRKVVAPDEDGIDDLAKVDAVLKPRILKEFYKKYDRCKFPKDVIAKNVLVAMNVPKDRVDQVYDLVFANGKYSGIIQDTKSGPFVFLGAGKQPTQSADENNDSGSVNDYANGKSDDGRNGDVEIPQELLSKLSLKRTEETLDAQPPKAVPNDRVFISHGKNRKMVDQLKELLTYGQFQPIVSVEKESTAIPVPEKVFDDMRSCSAAIIHVEGDEIIDKDGNTHHIINQNVLIEIGAAIALYGKRFVLLCQSSLTLPSNLQGLYRCTYDGKELNYEATMKLLKVFNDFRMK